MRAILIFLLTAFFMFGCVVDQGKVAVDIKRKIKEATSPSNLASASISNVQIINNQLVITGSGLNGITNVKVNGNSLNQNFTIETKSATQIIANAVSAFSFDVSKFFNLIISDASASATFPIDFSLCNATLNGKAFNCAITATDKDVLSYDAVSGKWKPRSINGLNYQGAWNANDPEPAGASSGDYYIVSVANAPYAVGDWIVWNGGSYDKINNSTTITSVFGRTGAIVATKGDYDLNKLTDVDLTVPATIGQVLKYDGSKWVAGSDLSGGGAGSVTTAELADGSVTDVKIGTVSASKITGTITSTQILDGTIVNADINAAAAIDYSKLNIPAGSIPYAKLNIANGDIPAAKISGLTAATSVLATTIVDGDSTHAPDGNAVFDALALKLGTGGGTLTIGTITGVPTPVNPSDVASKSYVDSTVAAATPSLDTDDVTEATNLYFTEPRVLATVLTGLNTSLTGPVTGTDSILIGFGRLQNQVTTLKGNGQWTKTVNDISYSAGDVQIDKNLKFKDSTTNFVEIKAPTAVTTYTLTLPSTAGSVDQVLRTNGSGVLTWVDPTDAAVKAFAKVALPTCASGEVLKSNGTAFSCVTDQSGAGSFTGATNKAVATDASGVLTTSATTDTELGYVHGVTSAIQTQLNAKEGTLTAGTATQYYKGDKTWATLNTTAVPEGTNLYFTSTRAKAATVADAIADSITDVAPSQNAVFDALALKLSTSGGALTLGGTITNVPTPLAPGDVVNKAYVDSAVAAATPSLDTDDVTEATNLYFKESRVLATILTGLNTSLTGPVTGADSVLIGFGRLQNQVTTLKGNGQWTKTGSDVSYSAGDVEVDQNLKLKDSGTNFVLLKAPSTVTATYTMTMPPAKASVAGQVLTSDTSGVLSWTTPASSAAPSGTAGGDLTGTYPNPTIATGLAATKIGGGAVDNTEFSYLDGVTSSIQTQLNAKQTADATLSALASYNTNGILVQTAADTFAGRSIAGTANRLTVTNGDGVAGNPTINIPTALLPSPVAGDVGKILKATAADTTAWTAIGLSDVTMALGFTPINKAGDSMSTGTFTLSGTAVMRTPDPIGPTDIANKQYVDSYGQWTKNGSDLYRASGNVGIGTSTPTSPLDLQSTITATTGNYFLHNLKTVANPGADSSANFLGSSLTMQSTNDTYNYAKMYGYSSTINHLSSGTMNSIIGHRVIISSVGTTTTAYGASYTMTGNFTTSYGVYTGTIAGTNKWSFYASDPTAPSFFAGNVGIGTSTPGASLDVNGTIRASQICDSTGANCKVISGGWGNIAAASMVTNWPDAIVCNSGSDSSILFHDTREGSSNLEYYTKASGGGTHSIRFYTSSGAAYDNTAFSGYTVCSAKSIATLISEGRTFGLLGGGVDWTVSGTNIYRAGGNVGIGTSTPFSLLDLYGGGGGAAVASSGTTDATTHVRFGRGAVGLSFGIIDSGAAYLQNRANANFATNYPISLNPNGGLVGVGLLAPGTALDVNGTIRSNVAEGGTALHLRNSSNGGAWLFRLAGDGTTSNNLYFYNTSIGDIFSFKSNGNMSMAGTLSQASDRRLKQNIQALENSLDKIIKLKGVSYEWIPEKKNTEKQIGLIAQDVEKVFPQVVRTDEKGWKSVAYQNLIAPVIEAIKELFSMTQNNSRDIASVKTEATVQAEKIKKLEEENAKLKSDMAEIKRMLNKKK